MEKIETLEAALKIIAELESENKKLREELEYYKNRKMSGRQKHGEWKGIGHCAVGYVDVEIPKVAKRKENRVFGVD